MGFHIRHQFELGAAAVKVLTGTIGVEIGISAQIVSQKTDTALERHELCAPGQVVNLRARQRAASPVNKMPPTSTSQGVRRDGNRRGVLG